jgi:hypothetical protein
MTVLDFTPPNSNNAGPDGMDDDQEPTEPIQLPERHGPRLTMDQQRERTPDYPYGRRADGTAKGKPGPRQTGIPGMAAAPKPRKTAAKKTGPAVPDYRPGLMGLLQIPIMGMSMIGRQTKNEALQADGMALAMHAPALAEAINETAKSQPQIGRALESLMKAGPYGALIGALVPLAMQLAANHGIMNPAPAMGIHAPADLVAANNEQLAAMAGAA